MGVAAPAYYPNSEGAGTPAAEIITELRFLEPKVVPTKTCHIGNIQRILFPKLLKLYNSKYLTPTNFSKKPDSAVYV